MSTAIRILSLTIAVFVALSVPAFAQDGPDMFNGVFFSGAFGAAVTIIGAGWGIGRIGSSAVESMARQPEIAGQIQTAMIIAAALVEGATFFALLVCWFGNTGGYLPVLQ